MTPDSYLHLVLSIGCKECGWSWHSEDLVGVYSTLEEAQAVADQLASEYDAYRKTDYGYEASDAELVVLSVERSLSGERST